MKQTFKKTISVVLMITMSAALFFGTTGIVFAEETTESSAWDGTTLTEFSGNGIESDPYVIRTGAELAYLANKVNAGDAYSDKYFELGRDLDLGGAEWTPIGASYKSFSGHFNGNGYSVKGLHISKTSEDNVGLFGLTSNAELCNLKVYGTITCSKVYAVAGIVGCDGGNTSLNSCSNYVNVSNSEGYYTAGIIGHNYFYGSHTSIESCRNYGNIDGTGTTGGIIARIDSENKTEIKTSVNKCGNYGKIDGESAGGITGSCYNSDVSITSCVNRGDINSRKKTANYSAGGIINIAGASNIKITDCYNTGDIYGATTAKYRDSEPYVAGILGIAYNNVNVFGVCVTNCYNTGSLYKTGNFPSTESRYDEITPTVNIKGNTYSGFETFTIDDSTLQVTNCYKHAMISALDSAAAAEALGNSFKRCTSGVNEDNTPLLVWEEDIAPESLNSLSFVVSGADNYTLSLYRDADLTEQIATETDGGFRLVNGKYYYIVRAEGCCTVSGIVNLKGDTIQNITLKSGVKVTFTADPDNTCISVMKNGSKITGEKIAAGQYEYWLESGESYIYAASLEGYRSLSGELNVSGEQELRISLEPSIYGNTAKGTYVFGSGNIGKNYTYGGTEYQVSSDQCTITAGGIYFLAPDATGVLTVNSSDQVVLTGSGIGTDSRIDELYIDCTSGTADLVLQDVFISNTLAPTNMINFSGKDNILTIGGISILEEDTNATGYAMIHVPEDGGLTLTTDMDGDGAADGIAYLYKREQGAGIGGNGSEASTDGQSGEANGIIRIKDAVLFAKGSKQGAMIGSGSNASSRTPGVITIENSELTMVAMSRGAAIGGSAGADGASTGSSVKVIDSLVTINLDYSGAAIGGGGFDAGNDSDGGVLIPINSSIRTFLDYNAIDPIGNGSGNNHDHDSLWTYINENGEVEYVKQAGVNGNMGITADIRNEDGQSLYLLELDTSDKKADAGTDGIYTVKEEERVIYSGATHQHAFINENRQKASQVDVLLTTSNWTSLNDANLYLYLTGEDHVLEIGGEKYLAVWDSGKKAFTLHNLNVEVVNYAAGKSLLSYSGDVEEGKVPVYTDKNADIHAMYYSPECKEWRVLVDAETVETISEESISFVTKETDQDFLITFDGDVNGNKTVNIIDAQIAYNIAKGTFRDFEKAEMRMWLQSDVNADRTVTAADARAIQCIIHGITA